MLAIILRNEVNKGFEIVSFKKLESSSILKKKPFIADTEIKSDLMKNVHSFFQLGDNEFDEDSRKLLKRIFGSGVNSVINNPIFAGEEYIGSLMMASESGGGFIADAIEMLTVLANEIGVALLSIKGYEERENLFKGIILALTRSFDAKSAWTVGHSERVAKLAEEIGIEMGLGEGELRELTVSAILHDVGKISIPESILEREGKLNAEEEALIKQHGVLGAKIVSDIGVIPNYEKIAGNISHHHELWDGSGYPQGLKGEAIPLYSRIIGVAEAYDAMTRDRPFRKALDRQKAVGYIVSNKGKLFDPVVVDNLVKVLVL